MKKLIGPLALIMIMLSSGLAFGGRLCRGEKHLSVAQMISNFDPKTDLNLLEYDFFPGGSVAVGYEYEVEPAFTKGLYFRTDRWQISTRAIPGKDIKLEEGLKLNLNGGLRNQAEATFIRSFANPCKAMLSVPYAPTVAPLNVNKAIKGKFKKGDYFLFRASLGFVVSGELLQLLGNAWGVSFGASYLVEGYYQLHIVRISDTHVRLKVIAHRGRDISATVGVGYLGDFEVFKVGVVDKQIKKFVETSPIKVTATRSHDKVMMVDYVLDLSDEEVGDAFNRMLLKVKDMKNLQMVGPFKKENDLEANLLLDLSELEDIYRNDFRNNNLGRLKRNLRASSTQKTGSLALKLGNKIIGFRSEGAVSTSKMSVRQPDDGIDRYLLRSWDRNFKGRFFYTWFRSESQKGMRALFSTDDDFAILKPINVVQHYNRKRTHLPYREFNEVKLTVRKALPKEVEAAIPWENWQQGRKDKFTNFGMRLQMVIAPEVLTEAPELLQTEIIRLYKDHLKSKGLKPEDFFMTHTSGGDNNNEVSAEEQFENSIRQASKLIERALNRKMPMLKRLDALTELRKNTIFNETGFSFLLALSPQLLKKSFHVDLNLSSNEALLDFEAGDSSISSLYKKLLTIKAALDDEGIDLLREAESLSVPEMDQEDFILTPMPSEEQDVEAA